jgi:hypothetical protein
MKRLRIFQVLIIALFLNSAVATSVPDAPVAQAGPCPPADPLTESLGDAEALLTTAEYFVGCGEPADQDELCNCEGSFENNIAQSEADEVVKEESEKVWLDAFQGEIWGLGQSLIDFDAARRKINKSSTNNIAPTCNVSSIFEKIASFAETEGCDGEVFQKRIKDVFKTDTLSEAQRSIVAQIESISKNEAPSSIGNPENICIPYTTYIYMKNGKQSESISQAKAEIDKKCETLVSDKIQPFFCSKELPEVDFNSFKNLVHPKVVEAGGVPRAMNIAFQHYCSSEAPVTGEATNSVQAASDAEVSSAISLEKREVTDFEKFNNGIPTDYETFNKNVCSLLPRCKDAETKNECRDTIKLRNMLMDSIKSKMPGTGSDEFLLSFSRNPEATEFDSSVLGNLTREEYETSSELLTYLNKFNFEKLISGSLKNQKSVSDNSQKKPIPTGKGTLTPKQIEAIKIEKEKMFHQGLFDRTLTFGKSIDLDKVENTKLLKEFVGGSIVTDPIFEPSTAERSTSSPTAAGPAAAENSPAQYTSPASPAATRNQQRSANSSDYRAPASVNSSYPAYSNSSGGAKENSGIYKGNSVASVGSDSSNDSSYSDNNTKDSVQAPVRRKIPRPINSERDRFENAYEKYSSLPDTSFSDDTNTSENGSRGPASSSGPAAEEYKDVKTGKKGGRVSGKPDILAGSEGGQGLVLDKDGKPVKGKLKTPAYYFDKIIPHVILKKLGMTKMILKYKLVGKRFNVLEIDEENNFILHTYDFISGGLAYQDHFDNNQYNIARIDILDQIEEIRKTDIDAKKTFIILAGKTKKMKSDIIKYEITKEQIIARTISPEEVTSILASTF